MNLLGRSWAGKVFVFLAISFLTNWEGHHASVSLYDEYPETGIDDMEFPLETSANPLKLLVMPVVQMVYCFSRAGQLVALGLAPSLKGR